MRAFKDYILEGYKKEKSKMTKRGKARDEEPIKKPKR